jgi:hypothetical protein
MHLRAHESYSDRVPVKNEHRTPFGADFSFDSAAHRATIAGPIPPAGVLKRSVFSLGSTARLNKHGFFEQSPTVMWQDTRMQLPVTSSKEGTESRRNRTIEE